MNRNFLICIIRPPGYLWSSVFQELAELISYSLEDLGYSAPIYENKFSNQSTNIILGAHLIDISLFHKIPLNSIIFNTEQIGVGPSRWNERILKLAQNFTTWDYSSDNILIFQNLGIPSPKLFTFGIHPRLFRINNIKKDIDVLFYGVINESRLLALNKIRDTGVKLVKISGKFGKERDEYIARSKLVLNLHQHSTKILEIVRLHYLMNNKKAILTQYDNDTKADPQYLDGLITSKYENIADACLNLINSDATLKIYEEKSYLTLAKFNSVKIVQSLIE